MTGVSSTTKVFFFRDYGAGLEKGSTLPYPTPPILPRAGSYIVHVAFVSGLRTTLPVKARRGIFFLPAPGRPAE